MVMTVQNVFLQGQYLAAVSFCGFLLCLLIAHMPHFLLSPLQYSRAWEVDTARQNRDFHSTLVSSQLTKSEM
jgi:hypothetical protein